MSAPAATHRELVFPNPVEKIPVRPVAPIPITQSLRHTSWLEVHRELDGNIRCHLGADGPTELSHTFHCLRETFPGLELGQVSNCPFQSARSGSMYMMRAYPVEKRHYWPMRLLNGADRAGLLYQSLASPELAHHEVVLQLLFRRVPYWEFGFLGSRYDIFVQDRAREPDRALLQLLHKRMAEPAYHVEIRAGVAGLHPEIAWDVLSGWLNSWSSVRGNPVWDFRALTKMKHGVEFMKACADHDILRCAAKRSRRDISASELAQILPIPWRDPIPGLSYAGAPRLPRPRSLALRSKESPGGRGIVIGRVDGEAVCLPENWHHLGILGKTRTGKSTFALNVIEQILETEPEARVIVLEPTGKLIASLVERLPGAVCADTIEVDPSNPTYEENGVEMATVPLNLLHIEDRHSLERAEYERRAERLMGNLLQSIKNAWGEESVGGRAEFILRAMVQGLLAVEGTNLADAYAGFSSKEVLRRLDQLVSQTALRSSPLRSTFREHLPRLDYTMTMSSLDKVGKVATNPLLRKTTCQRYRPVTFEELLHHRLLLLNLAKGTLGADSSTFLGAIFLTQLWSALQQRPWGGRPTYLVVDEFPNFAIPAFADMLSEGASLGLHVIAITQYLSRIPERIRSALVGNADAWVLFEIGAEDMRDAYDLVQGARFRWKPDHLVGGLMPYQAGLATRESLTKIDTLPPTPPSSQAKLIREVVQKSSRRYAQPEDSETSPLSVTWNEVDAFLDKFIEAEGKDRQELSKGLGWPLPLVNAVIAYGKADGDLTDRSEREVGLTARGAFLRQILRAARNEGEEHNALLAHSAAALHFKQVRVKIVVQRGPIPLPDAEFEWHNRSYNLEVECTTMGKHEQLTKNLRKALDAGRRCLVIVPDRQNAITYVDIMRRLVPEAELWKDFGLAYPDRADTVFPYSPGPRKPWGFLTNGIDLEDEEEPVQIAGERVDPGESDVAWVLKRCKELVQAGRWDVSAKEFDGVFGLNDSRDPASRQRLGFALTSLGVRGQRIRRADGSQERIYDLRRLVSLGTFDFGVEVPPAPPDSSSDKDDDRPSPPGST